MDQNGTPPRIVVVMGVSGVGKTRIGSELAARMRVEYRDGDAFHSRDDIEKMARGIPLDDRDRTPWLDAIAAWLHARRATGAVVSCSALRRSYRDRLRAVEASVHFLHLVADSETVRSRVDARRGHFMPPSLVQSQFATLEPLAPDEYGVSIDARRPPEQIIAEFLSRG